MYLAGMKPRNYPVSISKQVRWGEMDALGHVNNTVYFRYFEDVRIVYFEKLGYKNVTAAEKVGPILARIDCNFRRPLVYPDTITVGAWVSKIGNTSMQLDYEVYSHTQEAVVAEGSSIVVMLDYSKGEKIAISEEQRTQIAALQGEI